MHTRNYNGVEKSRYALFHRRCARAYKGKFSNLHFRRNNKISMTIGDIKVEGVEYLQFLDIEIIESAHHHGICKLVFVVDSKLDTKKILSWNKTQIKIKADKEIIFCGIIRQCNLEKRIDGNFLFVTAFSLSSQLDEVRRTMSFQSAKKKFSDILSAVKKITARQI